ncbi:peroxiredoxin [Sphingomonas sp. DBB INV C78]|uniref:peroxiredoxin n=1 Tax=Sphingomonas sp. DBB INV C78 TaxID=3349434 RepID=UPI0036D24995
MLNEGDQAPNVTLQMSDGSMKQFAELVKPLVLYFYPKDDTPGCTTEAQAFTTLAGDFAKAGVGILGVSKDTSAKHQKFAAKYDLKVDLATDADDSVCEAFGTWVEKSLYGRQYMGIERATFLIGKDGRVARIWRKVKVKGHAEEVLKAAQALT